MTLVSLTRWKAAAIHVGLSALVAATVVVVMLALWYPQPYFEAMGGRGLLALVVGVDVTIGPLLTLVVFDPKKKELKVDLAVIGALQVAALAYGAWVTFEARPVYTVFVKDLFDAVSANQLDPVDLEAGPPEYRHLSLMGPRVIGARLPTDPKERDALLWSSVAGRDAQQLPKYYVPYADVAADAIKAAQPVPALVTKHPEAAAGIRMLAAQAGRPESGLAYVPLRARRQDMTVILDASDGRIVGILPIDPF